MVNTHGTQARGNENSTTGRNSDGAVDRYSPTTSGSNYEPSGIQGISAHHELRAGVGVGFKAVPSPFVAHAGITIRDEDGEAFGTGAQGDPSRARPADGGTLRDKSGLQTAKSWSAVAWIY
ncbi:hypothetical protein DCS_05488 [Drechmeria coniospora]|uniref:Uncharacterized protein n=1 Tax=Drechmeria coniospora TaxID=98403 RepID=A0A151GNA4_DRECN|nr:hypothetical protein DCS_05488 [Drechmeria coniospora]KYK58472.1 hypothetical protein DCS_05488 [Drechmeria coniospora]